MGNRIGMQAGYWWGTPVGRDLEQNIAYTAEIGADYVELNPSVFLDMDSRRLAELRRLIEGHGLGVSVNGSMMSPDANLAAADPAAVAAGLERCERVMHGCAALGAEIWTGVMHGLWGSRPAPGDIAAEIASARARGLEGVARAMPIAARYGVTMCLEVVNRFENYYLNTVADGAAFCREVGDEHCMLLLDTYHMAIEEDNVAGALRLAQEQGCFGCLHAGETNRRIPVGEASNLDWAGIGRALRESGYAGPVTLEPYVFLSPHYSPAVCVWRSLMDPGDLDGAVETGKRGVRFLRGLLEQGLDAG